MVDFQIRGVAEAVRGTIRLGFAPFRNREGMHSLVKKELIRFCKVPLQTIVAPTSMMLVLYAIISFAFGVSSVRSAGLPYLLFLMPGLVAMAAAQNAFDNNISSIVTAKLQGSFVDILMAPLLPREIVAGFVAAGIARGLLVGAATLAVMLLIYPVEIGSFLLVFVYLFLGTFLFSVIGFLGGVWAETYDQSKAITNFFVVPLIYLSGTFYSSKILPSYLGYLMSLNPFFYYVDGVRYAFIGYGETSPTIGIALLAVINATLWMVAVRVVDSGYRLKS